MSISDVISIIFSFCGYPSKNPGNPDTRNFGFPLDKPWTYVNRNKVLQNKNR